MSELHSQVHQLADRLRKARRILLFTGAGVSTGSGIPDYRGPNGVWTRRKPVFFQDFLASEEARIQEWDFSLEQWAGFRDAKPNATHASIVCLERAGKLSSLITQNIDGLHAKAGNSPGLIIEVHGTNMLVGCVSCGVRVDPTPAMEQFKRTRKPPLCSCGGFLKLATISFGQGLPDDALARAANAVYDTDLVIAMGSTLSVYPAASIPHAAASMGIPYVIINQGATDHDRVSELSQRIDADVAEVFPPAVEAALCPEARSDSKVSGG